MRWPIAAATLMLLSAANADHEPHYSEAWCDRVGGEAEVVVESGDRVDCVVPRWVVEVECGSKIGIGQSLDYGEQTAEAPGFRFWSKTSTIETALPGS